MITSWQDYECWKEAAERYHSNDPSRLASFKILAERAYKYFRDNGFPVQTEKYKNGKLKPWSDKAKKQQKEDMRNYDVRSKQDSAKKNRKSNSFQ